MPKSTGRADLPLHGGRVPAWLAERMARLGAVIVEALVLHYGRDEVLRRLAHPFWFQALGAVMGMDWHSSGITTSVLGALKRGLAPRARELGIYVCGGRGKASRRTPDELCAVAEETGLDGDALARASRLVAKVDSAAVQDGYELYLHGFIVTDDGRWTVVQQGMSGERRMARRYHWLSEALGSFVDAPHAAIEGEPGGAILNLTDARAEPARLAEVALIQEDPEGVLAELARGRAPSPELVLPMHHDVRTEDVDLRRLRATVLAAHERGPRDFAELLLTPGLGARTVRALAFVAEILHGAPSRFRDPARFSLAHGGKDGHPFPVPLRVYDETVQVLRRAVGAARLGDGDRLAALRRLDDEARRIERALPPGEGRPADLADLVAHDSGERRAYGGRTVFDDLGTKRREAPARTSPERRAAPSTTRAQARNRPPAKARDAQLDLPFASAAFWRRGESPE